LPIAGQRSSVSASIRSKAMESGAQDIQDVSGHKVNYPIIGDTELKVAKLYDMLPADAGDSSEGRTPALNAPVRTVFVIGPDKRIKLTLAYPMTTGRNFDEIIRVLDSMLLTSEYKVATPADWKQGDEVIITNAVSDEEAEIAFPGYKTVKPYLRTTKQPK
jgi:thioredoxin-dependent peroxiredoxin